jgi:RNase P/RNase MRP subunit p30
MENLNIKFNLPVSVIKEGARYVAYTPALDLSTCGKTIKIAKKRFNEAVGIFFEELIKSETLEQVLLGLGWQKKRAEWTPPAVVSSETQSFCVAV